MADGHEAAEPALGEEKETGTIWRGESCRANSGQGATMLIPGKAVINLVIAEKLNLGLSIAKLG